MSAQKTQFIKDISAGDEIDSLFLLSQASQMQAKNGPFWRLELKDKSGSIEAKIWSPLSQSFSELNSGSIVKVVGRANLYRDRLDINVESFAVLPEDDWARLDLSLFLPASEKQPELMWQELELLCNKTMRHPPWKKFIQYIFRDEFIKDNLLVAPAAKGVHHAYRGGLLEHTLGVANLCMQLADSYPQLDRQLLLAGAVCHDLGKLWELTGGAGAPDYTDEGRLIGHIELGLEAVAPYLKKSGLEADLVMQLKHLILSHHGELEFGSPKRPKIAEAFALHYADNIDAKMAQIREVIGAMPPPAEGGTNWSPFQTTLSRFLYRATPTPDGGVRQGKPKPDNGVNLQGSLLPGVEGDS